MAKKKRRGSRKSSRGSKRDKRFSYKRRSRDQWQSRAEQSGYSRQSMFVDEITRFTPKDQENLLRILPPTFEDAEHYGFEIFVHYSIGPDNDSFLCLKAMNKDPCPVCEERSAAVKDDDKEYADKLVAKKRVLVYLVDRDDEDKGLQLWAMPWTLDADITTLAVDKRTGEVLDVDDPKNGYDIEFTKTGKGLNTKYMGIGIARRSSRLDNDEALEEAIELPLPDCLKFYEYDEIQKIFDAGGSYEDEEEEEEEEEEPRRGKKRGKKKRGRKYSRDDEEEEEEEEEPEVEWQDVQQMDLDDLSELIENEDLDVDDDIDEDEEEEMEDLRNEVCDELGLNKPKKRKAKKQEKNKIRRRGRGRRR